jgi:adenosylcobinamide-GDP ribazoletransferase
MRRLVEAIRFLTIVPLPGAGHDTADELPGATAFFPVVGILIGVAAACLATGLWALFPAGVASVLLVTALAAVSGGFHMDGLADTADGFFSARPKARVLEIMKDSHIGAMGVMAVVCVLAMKVAAIASMGQPDVWKAAFLMPVAGRCSLVIGIAILPAAGVDGGLGKLFSQRRSSLAALWALAVLSAAGWATSGSRGLIAAGAAVVVVAVFSAACYGKIGGSTGDTLGATCELAETAVALAWVAKPIELLA